MVIDIFSDVRCPFCYIGKRKFEAALEKFPQRDKIKVNWKSFQLDPTLETRTDISTVDYFVKAKGVSREQAKQMLGGATQMAKEVGLNFNLEDSVLANSFNAHRLIQMAKTKSLGNEIEEALFKVHFEEARNIDDFDVLIETGESIGLNAEEVKEVLASNSFEYEVKQDEMDARNIGVRGVPFFVFDNRYGVSGAQSTEAFLQTLEKSWEEYTQKNNDIEIIEGDSCKPDGNCD
ncbi:DsbA family oxidoreductase [Antarcticibacterium flavum]|uniref:DsbA family oxidoreductase n=1 Tax=Antarcticibacterium flavum TaxID=2058175 RepID=A0A5B7WZL1_9FLAO|nr:MULTISPECIES: DsbA family oxidoreductase [Antarcticibacterium]MCM4161236.1 disulfide bond formation protein DsbA [Antarcticibacterium sp. W02-3]QCY68447.1 DsbA family oxidoreductase [Antarcticibacterium flavum]